MSQEEYLLSFVPQISDTTDPLQDELEPLLNDYQITEDELNATKDEYAHLKLVKKPADFKEVWLGGLDYFRHCDFHPVPDNLGWILEIPIKNADRLCDGYRH